MEHWSGYLAADRYQMSDKFEYFAVRNAAGVFDSSPLYKYRIAGKDAEAFLAGMLARDIRACPPGHAQYTTWLDDRGFVVEDGVILRKGRDEYLLTSAEPNFAWFADRIGRLDVHRGGARDIGTLALQGPRSRALLARLVPQMEHIPYFGLATGEIGGAAVTVSRTGYSGDLGYEIWVDAPDALHVWDTLWDSWTARGPAVRPGGTPDAAHRGGPAPPRSRLRLEPVRLERRAALDADRARLGWMFRGLEADDRAFIGRRALEREIADKTSRWKMSGLVVDWHDYDRVFNEAGLIPPKDHTPVQEDWLVL